MTGMRNSLAHCLCCGEARRALHGATLTNRGSLCDSVKCVIEALKDRKTRTGKRPNVRKQLPPTKRDVMECASQSLVSYASFRLVNNTINLKYYT